MKPHSQAGLGNYGKGVRAPSVRKRLTCSDEEEWGACILCCREDGVFGSDGVWPLLCGAGLFLLRELLQGGQESIASGGCVGETGFHHPSGSQGEREVLKHPNFDLPAPPPLGSSPEAGKVQALQ